MAVISHGQPSYLDESIQPQPTAGIGDLMSRLKANITRSLDGFVAGPDQRANDPFGIGGERLHQSLLPFEAFRERHGEQGGKVNASTPFAEEILGDVGATIMGRNMFGGGPGTMGRRSLDDPALRCPRNRVNSTPERSSTCAALGSSLPTPLVVEVR